jgi:GTP-binding protein
MSRTYNSYGSHVGAITGRRNGVLVSNAPGKTVAYALANLEGRGFMFISSGVPVYEGMIIGEHSKSGDLDVNPMKGKQLTNVRASGTDDAVRLTTPRSMNLEEAIAYIDDDELVEVTPENVRLRKTYLDPHERKRVERGREKRG